MKRSLAVLLGVVALLFLGPSASAAPHALPDVFGCTDAPTPEVPGRGITGFFESPPDPLPAPGDPFAEHPTTTIYAQYGYAGLRFTTYDLGCGPDEIRAPSASVGTDVANWILIFPKAAVAATGATLSAALAPDFLGVFDPLIERVVAGLRDGLWTPWFPLVTAAMGLLLIYVARRQQVSETAAAIGGAVLIMVVVTAVFQWPLVAGHAANESVTAVLGGVGAGLNGKDPSTAEPAGGEATAGMHEALLYQIWLGGTFGSADSAAAKKYGPAIFDATALTWAEEKTLRENPEAGKAILDAKKKKFEDTANLIKESDPDAYESLTGRKSDVRVGYALLAVLGALCAVPFLFMAALLILGALLIVRFGVMLFPAFATLGIFPTLRGLVTGIGGTVAIALINALVAGIGALVFVLCLGVALSAPIAAWQRILIALLLTIVFWIGLKPYRRLTQMPTGQGAFRDAVAGPGRTFDAIRGLVMKIGGAVITGGTAGAVAGAVAQNHPEPQAPPQRIESRPDPFPVVIHQPAPQITARPDTPPLIVAEVTDLPPSPRRARAVEAPAQPAIEAESTGPAIPARMEGATPAYALDWTTYEAEVAKEHR